MLVSILVPLLMLISLPGISILFLIQGPPHIQFLHESSESLLQTLVHKSLTIFSFLASLNYNVPFNTRSHSSLSSFSKAWIFLPLSLNLSSLCLIPFSLNFLCQEAKDNTYTLYMYYIPENVLRDLHDLSQNICWIVTKLNWI